MRGFFRIAGGVAIAITLASGAEAQQASSVAGGAAAVKALESAMAPGEGQAKLGFLIGNFDVKIRTWINPSKPPYESAATSVATWVLGNRYVQQMFAGHVMGEPWSGIGYVGYDNVAKKYVVTYMDSGSTGMEWFTGSMAPDGKSGKLTATIHDAVTGKPTKAEMRIVITADGQHATEMWRANPAGKLVKVMELHYSRRAQ